MKRTQMNRRGRARRRDIPTRVRVEVKERSEGWCEASRPGCRHAAVHMHHRTRRSQGGEHTAENLVHLCLACHEWVHANPAAATELGLLRSHQPEGDTP